MREALARGNPGDFNRHLASLDRSIRRRALWLLRARLPLALQGEAEDLYQDFLARLPAKLPGYRGSRSGSAWSWIRSTLVHQSIDFLRSQQPLVLFAAPPDRPAAWSEGAPDESEAPPEDAERRAGLRALLAFRILKRCLAQTSPRYRRELARNLRMLRDSAQLDAGELACKYFAIDTPRNRNRVSQYIRRALEKLHAARAALDTLPMTERGSP
jgi:DNA-directed RNA polymerase specialized sigma24 family protein